MSEYALILISKVSTYSVQDKDLIPLLLKDPNYAKKNFQWCILETLPLSILGEQAIDRESLYKRKFGTRDFGYNNN